MPRSHIWTKSSCASPYAGSRSTTSWPSSLSSFAGPLPGDPLVVRDACDQPGGTLRETAIRSRPRRLGRGLHVAARRTAAPAGLVAGRGAVHHVEQQRAVGDGPRQRAEHRQPEPARATRLRGTRPRVGFIPTRPQHAAGIRIEPPPSDARRRGDHAGRHRARRAARGAARRALEMPWVAGDAVAPRSPSTGRSSAPARS